ncbi:MAG: HepT-like ribonuclease domain-containing protein [Actinomycetota bacterium]
MLEALCSLQDFILRHWTRSYRAAYDIPWRRISGTRDRLAHGYYNVDLNIVWDILENHLDQLDVAVRGLLDRPRSP